MNEPALPLPAVERLRLAIQARTRAEIDEAVALADLAAEHQWSADAEFDVRGARPVLIGADGTALIDEFLPLEVAALKGISVTAATGLIADVVNLKARHPMLWARMTQGLIPVFRACQLAYEIATHDLNLVEARELDDQLGPHVGSLSWRRLLTMTRGLIATVAADKAAAAHRAALERRFVRKYETNDAAVSYLGARVDTADAVYFDAMVDRIADILGARGDADAKEVRRAKAIGVLATPARATLLLAEAAGYTGGTIKADDPRLLPRARVFVHVAEETLLTGRGTCRVEGVGPLAATMLRHLVGHARIKVSPVIRPYSEASVDCYEIPRHLRRQVMLRDTFEVFPWSSRSARTTDADHTEPYRTDGPPRQTRTSNLGPLSRRTHRAKTHGGWQLEQPKPGVFYWTSPAGYRYRVGPEGTRQLDTGDAVRRSLDVCRWQRDHGPAARHRPEPDESGP